MATISDATWQHNRTKYKNTRTAQEYDRIRYRGLKGRIKNAIHARILAKAFRDVPEGSLVVDMPCGTGRFTPWLAEQGYRAVGADISAEMLEVARDKASSHEQTPRGYLVSDLERLPHADKSVDATLTVRFFHLLPAARRPVVYRELARVTRGTVVLCVNCNKWSLKHLAKRIRGKKSDYWMGRSELVAELGEGGLEVQRIHSKGGPLSTLWVVVCKPA